MKELLENRVLMSAILGWLVAQILKVIIDFIRKGKFDIERLSGAGGMPSSHSCMVTALTISAAIAEGVNSTVFALSLAFAFITLYDAMGVRWQAGLHARVLNKYVREVEELKEAHQDDKEDDATADGEELPEEFDDLKEFIGHKPMEVLVGVMLGIVIAMLVCFT